jgi:hypothetical protein
MWRVILSGTILGTALFLIGGQITVDNQPLQTNAPERV